MTIPIMAFRFRACRMRILAVVMGALLAAASGVPASAQGDAGAAGAIYVREIQTDPSKILTEAEIEEIVAPYEGRMLGVAELEELVARFNALYAERGYVTAKAFLPAQTVEDGVVRITLVEGVVGAVRVEGNTSTRTSYVTNRMTLRPGDLVQLDILERDIARFNATNDVQLRAQLVPGESFGTTDYVLHAVEPPRWGGTLNYANSGRSQVGLNQLGLTLTDRSLFGLRDRLSLGFVSARGTSGGSIAYSIPISRGGARLGVVYYKNDIAIVEGGFEAVDIGGAASGGSIALSSPLVVEPGSRVSMSLEFHVKDSGTYFEGVKLIGGRVESVVFTVATQLVDDQSTFDLALSVTNGWSDSPSNAQSFGKLNLSFTRQSVWRSLYKVKVRGMMQGSNADLLPNLEQFSLGGMESVRGIPAGHLIGDDGYFFSAQIGRPLAGGFELFGFVDHGGVYPFKGNDEGVTPEDFSTTVGLGTDFTLFDRLTGTVVYGFPLREEQRSEGGWGRLHFRLDLAF